MVSNGSITGSIAVCGTMGSSRRDENDEVGQPFTSDTYNILKPV